MSAHAKRAQATGTQAHAPESTRDCAICSALSMGYRFLGGAYHPFPIGFGTCSGGTFADPLYIPKSKFAYKNRGGYKKLICAYLCLCVLMRAYPCLFVLTRAYASLRELIRAYARLCEPTVVTGSYRRLSGWGKKRKKRKVGGNLFSLLRKGGYTLSLKKGWGGMY